MTNLLFGDSEVTRGISGDVSSRETGRTYGNQVSGARVSAVGETSRYTVALFGAFAVMIGIKAALLASGALPFNSDEAIVALMARHILAGERPIFFYGQAYMGSLDAYLAALGFRLFGQEVWVIRALQALLYLGTVLTTVRIASMGFGSRRSGVLAAWFLAIPTVTTSLYTVVSLGGYGEALLIGNIILLLVLRIAKKLERQMHSPTVVELLAFGFACGLGFWASGLTLVYSLPALVFFIIANSFFFGRRIFKNVVLVALGGVLGASPWLYYAFQHGSDDLLIQLGGGMISGVQRAPLPVQILQHVFNFAVFGVSAILGLRPSWEFRWLAFPLIPLVLVFWGYVAVQILKKIRSNAVKGVEALILGVGFCLVAGFVFTPFGADPSGRYFLPFSILLALLASDFITRFSSQSRQIGWALAGLILVFNLWGTVECAIRNPPGLTTQIDHIAQIDHRSDPALAKFLLANNERRGYSNYWVAYPLAFESQEELIFTPRLPYHEDFRYTLRDDRYPTYDDQVERSERAAYITTNHPALDDRLREGFSRLKISWKEAQIGDYHVFYALSQHVRPEELGLGVESR